MSVGRKTPQYDGVVFPPNKTSNNGGRPKTPQYDGVAFPPEARGCHAGGTSECVDHQLPQWLSEAGRLTKAMEDQDDPALNAAIAAGIDVNERERMFGETALHTAAKVGLNGAKMVPIGGLKSA